MKAEQEKNDGKVELPPASKGGEDFAERVSRDPLPCEQSAASRSIFYLLAGCGFLLVEVENHERNNKDAWPQGKRPQG